MKPPKPLKPSKNAHTAASQTPMGDHYGSGIRQKVGRMREDQLGFTSPSSTKLKKPPKSLA
jgi:hypothetical protein